MNKEDEIQNLRYEIGYLTCCFVQAEAEVERLGNRLRELKARLANMEGRRDDQP
jgi:hypothetical protein